MGSPSPEKIKELKALYPERSLHQVDLVDTRVDADGKKQDVGELFTMVMTGPSSDEHKKFTDEMLDAKDKKDEKERIAALRGAILRAVLGQTRWPAREEVQKFFEMHPEAVDDLSTTLREHAGSNAEVRSKKL